MNDGPGEEILRSDTGLPHPIAMDLDSRVLDLWRSRINHVVWDTYAGVPLVKFPEDLRIYEHLLWQSAADVVIELGTYAGGSALWFRDRLRAQKVYGRGGGGRVIAVDLDMTEPRKSLAAADPDYERDIELIEADVLDPDLPERVAQFVEPGASCLVIDDSGHTFETTLAVLTGFARFVQPDGYFVVEDTCEDYDEMRVYDYWPRGELAAIDQWRETTEGRQFEVRREMELYGLTCNPRGILQRR